MHRKYFKQNDRRKFSWPKKKDDNQSIISIQNTEWTGLENKISLVHNNLNINAWNEERLLKAIKENDQEI